MCLFLGDRLGLPPHTFSTAKTHHQVILSARISVDRSRAIFEWVFGLPPLDGASLEEGRGGGGYTLGFMGVDDQGIDFAAQRTVRERKSLEGVKKLAERIGNVSQLHGWLYTEHDAYSAGGRVKRLQGKDRVMYGGGGVDGGATAADRGGEL
jgi:hypothetical protein